MKKKRFTQLFLSFLFVLLGASLVRAQYSETFSTPNKGYLINCANDFSGVNWTLSPWDPTGTCQVADPRDPTDYFNTTAAGVLESIDADQEVYWESPLLNISGAGTVSLAVALSWVGFDSDVMANTCATDFIKVQYSINGGAFVTVANQFGGNACATVSYPFANPGTSNTASGTVTQGGLSGTTLRIRVVVFTNANAEIVTIDNISVPQAGVTLGCTQPTISAIPANIVCNGANSGSIKVTASGATAPYNISWSGTSSGNPPGDEIVNSGGMSTITNLTAGTYTVSVTDAASCTATTTVSIVSSPITQSAITSQASCGMSNGTIDLSVSGGNSGYTYNWSNGAMTQDISGLAAGNYTVTITDSSVPGCTSTAPYTVGTYANAPYNETFSVPGRGYLLNQVDNLFGVNWTLSPWITNQPETGIGRGNDDYLRTTSLGKLSGTDTDAEICWTSPLLNISSSGTVQFSLDLSWSGFDDEDYISVRHSVNGGAFVTKPNQVGGGAQTIQYAAPAVDQPFASTTVTQTGLSGNTLQMRVCFLTNSQADTFSLDNVVIPQTVSQCFFVCPTLAATSTTNYPICSGDNTSDISVSTTVNDLNVKLVYFTSPQATNALRYTGGTMIGSSTTPVAGAVAFNNLSFPVNNTASPIIYYVYAILDVTDPQYTDNTCQPSVAFEVTVNPTPVAPTSASSDVNNFCSNTGGNISLTAVGGSGTTLNWYTGSCGGTLVGTGTPLVIAKPTTTTTYYARWETTCGNSTCAQVTVTVNPVPVAPTSAASDVDNFCSNAGGNINLSATGGSGATLNWYTVSCGGTPVGTGTPLVIAKPTTTTTYYARWESPGCTSSTCAQVTVTVIPAPVAPTSAASDVNNFCADAGGNISLSAVGGSGTTLNWYTGSCGGTPVGTGTPLVIAKPTTTTTYYARWETTGCAASTCAQVTVTVNPVPVAPTSAASDVDNFCSNAGGNISLSAVGGSGTTLNWYTVSCGGTPVGTGTPLVIAKPTTTTTYYARWESPGCTPSTCVQVTVTVIPAPVAPTNVVSNDDAFCSNKGGTFTLTANGGSGGTLVWYTDGCGDTQIGTGSPLVIARPTSTTIYYARWETLGCAGSACAQVTVSVIPAPVAPTSAASDVNNFCSNAGGNISLTATGGSGGTLVWYTGSCGGTQIGTGTPLVIAKPTTTTTYYARWESGGCAPSTCVQVTVTVIPAPVAPTSVVSDDDLFCSNEGGNLSLTATGGSGGTLVWYTGGCGNHQWAASSYLRAATAPGIPN